MRITVTGKQERLTPTQERKLAMQFAKLSKLLERRGEKEAQVILNNERHLHHAEVRILFYGQALVGATAATDQYTATMSAVEKVQKQALKIRTKFRDTKRDTPARVARTAMAPEVLAAPSAKPGKAAKAAPPEVPPARGSKPSRVVRATAKVNGKPMTVDEAMLAMEGDLDYMVYRDAQTDKVNVLIRRRDGKVDLVEA
jgi:putative sigma-54 modulation protein